MTERAIPHFHNDVGVAVIRVRAKEFMCMGATPPFDHPHVFLDMAHDGESVCSYCSTRYVYDGNLKSSSDPADCEWSPVA